MSMAIEDFGSVLFTIDDLSVQRRRATNNRGSRKHVSFRTVLAEAFRRTQTRSSGSERDDSILLSRFPRVGGVLAVSQ